MRMRSRGAVSRLVLGGAFAIAAATVPAVAGAQSTVKALGIDTTNFDRSVRPQDDFFRFVNGGWLNRTEIPGDAASWGSFNELREASRTALHTILDSALTTKAAPGSELQKVRDLYKSYMDSAAVEASGTKPLQPELQYIAAVKSTKQLPATFAHMARIGVQTPLGLFVGADQKASRTNIVSVSQSGLGLPDRDFYLKTDAKSVELRNAYHKYIVDVLTAANQPDPSGAADRILALETKIAEKHWTRAHNRDRDSTYNKMTVAQLAAMAPDYSIPTYLQAAGLSAAKNVVVRQPSYVPALDTIIASTPISTWRDYLTFKLIDSYANELPSAFQNARFDFRGRAMSGQAEMSSRWKRGVDEVGGT